MNHRNGFNPLSRTSAHRRAMSRNMVTSLFRFERITTTKAKALEVRKAAEYRRQVAKFIQDEKILNKVFTEIGPRMKDRQGGYTRILKIGFRQGDAADMVILELVDYKLDTDAPAKKAEKKAAKATRTAEGKTEKPAKKAKTSATKADSEAPAKAKKSASTKKTAKVADTAENKE